MANLIKIGGGSVELSGDASDNEVLNGKTYYSNDPSVKRIGTMPNRNNWSTTVNAGESVIIPNGYHNGQGVVRSNKTQLSKLGTLTLLTVGTGGSENSTRTAYFDVKNVRPYTYQNFKTSDFAQVNIGIDVRWTDVFGNISNLIYSYDNSSGTLTVSYQFKKGSAGANVTLEICVIE